MAGVVSGLDKTPAASLEGVSLAVTYYQLNSNGSKTLLDSPPSAAGRYEVIVLFPGSDNYAAASTSATFTSAQAKPVFSLVPLPAIKEGTASLTVSGTLSLGDLVPTGQVIITVNGARVTATVQTNDSFSATVATGSLAVGSYTLTYKYTSDENFAAVTGEETLRITIAS